MLSKNSILAFQTSNANMNLVKLVNMLCLLSFICKNLCSSSINLSEFRLPYEIHEGIFSAAKVLKQQAFKTLGSKAIDIIFMAEPNHKHKNDDLLDTVIKNVSENDVIRVCSAIDHSLEKDSFSLILIHNIRIFRDSKKYIHTKKFYCKGFYVIIHFDGTIQDIHEILDHFWSQNIYNVYFLTDSNGTAVVTFEPFEDPQKCEDTTPKIVTRFSSGKFHKSFVSNKRFHNLNKCPIRVTTFTNSIVTFKETFADGSFVHKGYEASFLRLISKMLNFTLVVQFRDQPGAWGAIYPNGTATHAFAELLKGETDAIIGNYMLKTERTKFFDYCYPYITCPTELVATKPPELSAIEKLLYPFQASVWICLLLTLGFGVCFILFISNKFELLKNFLYGQGVHSPIMNIYLTILGISQPVLPTRNFARFILTMFVLLCLILRTVYQGGLFKFLQTDQYSKEPHTVADLIDQKYSIVTIPHVLDVLGSTYKNLFKSAILVPLDQIEDINQSLGTREKAFMIITREDLLSHSLHHDDFPYFIVKEKLYLENYVMYFAKDYVLKIGIDESIQQIKAGGFFIHWTSQYDRTDKWKQKKTGPKVIMFKHLRASFNLLLIGFLLASVTFLIEVGVKKFNRTL